MAAFQSLPKVHIRSVEVLFHNVFGKAIVIQTARAMLMEFDDDAPL